MRDTFKLEKLHLDRKGLVQAIEKGTPIGEVCIYTKNGEKIDSDFFLNPYQNKELIFDDIYTLSDKTEATIENFTTLLKDGYKDSVVFGKVKCRAYSEKLERSINKNIIFYFGKFKNLHTKAENPHSKITDIKDEGEYSQEQLKEPKPVKDMSKGYLNPTDLEDVFISFGGKEVF